MAQPVGPGVEVRVAEQVLAADQGQRVGGAVTRVLEELVQALRPNRPH